MADINTSLIIVPRISRNKRIYSGSTVLSQSSQSPQPGSGTTGLVPYIGADKDMDLGANKIKAAEFWDANDNQRYAVQNGTILYHSAKWFTPASNQTLTVSADGLSLTLANPVTNFQFLNTMPEAKIIVNGIERLINTYTSTSVVTVKKSHTNGIDAFPIAMRSQVYAYTDWGIYSRAISIINGSYYIEFRGSTSLVVGRFDKELFYPLEMAIWSGEWSLRNGAQGSAFMLARNYRINWSNTTGHSGTKDIGIRRCSYKLLQIYDGITNGSLADLQLSRAKIGTSYITCLTTATNNTAVTSIAADTSSFPATGTILIGGVTSVAYTSKTATTFVFASKTIPTYAIGTIIELTAGATISYTEIGSTGEIKTNYGGAVDIGISRSAAGEYEVNNGTSGTKRDLTARKIKADRFNLSALNTAPSSATDTGTAGEIRITASYIYVCTATDTWVRAALATW